jgi:hypothetical protein
VSHRSLSLSFSLCSGYRITIRPGADEYDFGSPLFIKQYNTIRIDTTETIRIRTRNRRPRRPHTIPIQQKYIDVLEHVDGDGRLVWRQGANLLPSTESFADFWADGTSNRCGVYGSRAEVNMGVDVSCDAMISP